MIGPSAPRALPIAEGELGACAGGHPAEVDAGLAILGAGGNAIDAAVAAAFAGFVVEQLDCGLGGFARISMWLEDAQRFVVLDGYVQAPAAAHESMFEVESGPESYYGHPETAGAASRYGARAVAIPGAVEALWRAHESWGSRPWSEVLSPAIELADRGVSFGYRDALAAAELQPHIERLPDTARVLLPAGRPPRLSTQGVDGARLDTRALARTLRIIAESGARGFYEGRVAAAIARQVSRLGGILSVGDLAGYRALHPAAEPARFSGASYVSGGDAISRRALSALDGPDLGGPDDVSYRHGMARALARGFTEALSGGRGMDKGTSQMVAADRSGNAVSIITAVGWNWGSLVYDPETGVFLNNGMLYFDPRPGRPASIAAGKRPLFGAPVMAARTGSGCHAIAGSGGYRIQSGVLHTLVNQVRHGMSLDAAIDHPRVHCQGGETFIDGRLGLAMRAGLEALGHRVVPLHDDAHTLHFGRVAAIRATPGGRLQACAGPPWMSAAGAI